MLVSIIPRLLARRRTRRAGWRPRNRTLVGALCLLGLSAPLAAETDDSARAAARRFREANGPRILRDYADLLSIPNTPADPEALVRNAAAIRALLAARGVAAELITRDGAPPIVYGTMTTPGARRKLGIYVHYDGQPVEPERWTHPPFEPTLYTASIESGGKPRALPADGEPIDPEWRLYGRSSGDDKAPLPALFAALDALHEAGISPTSDLVFFFEGEEERGSPHLRPILEQHRDRLDVDLWLICDGPVHASRRPQLVFGVRGYTGLDITVYGAERNLHSGHYGNWAPNPALELSRLLAGMKDATGRVLVEGFYDTVAPLTERDREALVELPDFDADLRAELGLVETEAGNADLAERILLPSLNIRGLQSATVGPTARNIIPAIAEASIDIRLVAGNDPNGMLDLVERHIAARGFHIVRATPDHATRLAHARIARVVRDPGYPSARTSTDLPRVREVIEAAQTRRRRAAPARPDARRIAAALSVHGDSGPADDHRADRQPRRQPARAGREPEDRQSVVRDRPVRRVADHALTDGPIRRPPASRAISGTARRRSHE